MAGGASGSGRNLNAKRDARAIGLVRLLGRIGGVTMIAIIVALVGVQFARVIGDNVAMSQQLAAVQNDVRTLEARKRTQLRELRRLSDPEGAIPEIHDRLRLVRPNEAIIFVRPAQSAATPDP